MTNLEKAKTIKNAFTLLINEIHESTNPAKTAPLLALEAELLKPLGYYCSSGGCLVELTCREKKKGSLQKRAESGDTTATAEFMMLL